MLQLDFHAMGCDMRAMLEADGPRAAEALADVPAWFETWEQHLSRFRANSELVRLNEQAGRPVPVSGVLWRVVQTALQAARESQGRVVPTLLDELEAAGYDRSFELIVAGGGEPLRVVERPASAPDWEGIRLDAAQRSIWLPAGARLDLGGIAKGWAADRAARRLSRWGSALVDAGGDLAVSGPLANDGAWPVGIGAPANWAPAGSESGLLQLGDASGATPVMLAVRRGGVATSGRDYRRWQQGGVWQHHLIDPATAAPAATDVLSATVIAPSARVAEMAAKVAVILGAEAGLDWIDARPELAALLVMDHGPEAILQSRRLSGYIWS